MVLKCMTDLEDISIAFVRNMGKIFLEAHSNPGFVDKKSLSVYTSSNLAVLQLFCHQTGKTFSVKHCRIVGHLKRNV